MAARPHSPSASSSSSSTQPDEHERATDLTTSSNASLMSSGSRKGKERAFPDDYSRSQCCSGAAAPSTSDPVSPLLHPGASSYSPPAPPSPWSLESLVHLTRRAARQLTMSSPGSSSDNAGYLPLYSAKQRVSSETFLEKEDGHSSEGSSNNEKCTCKHRQRSHSHYHNQQHYHPPSSLRVNTCLSPTQSHPSTSITGHGINPNGRRCSPLVALVRLAVIALALLGVSTIVGFATGLLQKTPMYTEKALQDAGWARRPITISRQEDINGSKQSQLAFFKDPYAGVTLHDFSPYDPLRALSAESSSSALSPSSSTSDSSSLSTSHTPASVVSSNDLHLLILCPLRNSAPDLPHLFKLLDGLEHPKANTSLGFLVGDEDDDTGDVLHQLVQDRANLEDGQRYRHISMLHKDFNLQVPSGANRHSYPVQLQRRSVMARARTYLLTATLEPSVDWVLWIDSDIAQVSRTLFQDLLLYGKAGVLETGSQTDLNGNNADETEWNDIIVPNAMKRLPDGNLLGFDMNNWAETPESLKLKAGMKPDHLLIEGNIWQHMHRIHLADQYVPYTTAKTISTSSPDTQTSGASPQSLKFLDQPEIFSSDPKYISSLPKSDQRLNSTSPAYIGRLEPLDGIGGVAALVRAEVHRMGAIFPSWIFENQLETEAFGVLAKRLGARVVGLPNLFVLHSS